MLGKEIEILWSILQSLICRGNNRQARVFFAFCQQYSFTQAKSSQGEFREVRDLPQTLLGMAYHCGDFEITYDFFKDELEKAHKQGCHRTSEILN